MTSADVVAYVRKTAKVKRVGHGGTLDPGAAGVLPIAIGPATRLVEYLHQCYKAYRAEVTFGVVTDTYDAQGKIVAAQPGCKVAVAHLERALDQFRGEIEQRPPAHSALKVQGRRLYELAREGVAVEARLRKVEIRELRLVKQLLPEEESVSSCFLDVVCSSGTYIRSLCHDLGQALGCGAYMSFLVRTQVGPFSLNQSLCLEELTDPEKVYKALVGPEVAVAHLPKIVLSPDQRVRFAHGNAIPQRGAFTPGEYGVYDEEGQLVGIGIIRENQLQPRKVFAKD